MASSTEVPEVPASPKRWQQSPDVLCRESLDAIHLLPAGSDEPFTLAGSGRAVWRALAQPSTTAELVERLSSAHGADASQVRSDVEPILLELAARGAIVRAETERTSPAGP